MAIQDLPPFFDMQFTKEDGRLTPDGYLYNDQTFQALDLVIKLLNQLTGTTVDQGQITIDSLTLPDYTVMPKATPAQITAYGADTNIPLGAIWYDTTNNSLKFKAGAGLIKEIQT